MFSSSSHHLDAHQDLNCTWRSQIPVRSSALFNEDDYDYALELAPDDEYRQVAEKLSEIVDFDEVEIVPPDEDSTFNDFPFEDYQSSLAQSFRNTNTGLLDEDLMHYDDLEANTQPRDKTDQHIQHRDSGIRGGVEEEDNDDENPLYTNNDEEEEEAQREQLKRSASNNSNGSVGGISLSHFSFRLKFLERQKAWVEKAARRSSVGYYQKYFSSEKEAMDKFLLTMAKGIVIRRHQRNKLAEPVRLFSTTGCKVIQWERAERGEIEGEGGGSSSRHRSSITSLERGAQLYRHDQDSSLFHCFIAICGCGDDLPTHYHHHSIQHTSSEDGRSIPDSDEHTLENRGESWRWWHCITKHFHNFGFKSSGLFQQADIIAVHRSTKEDPTAPGMFATEDLRGSKDVFNRELTFSIIVKEEVMAGGGVGYASLDIECFSEEEYVILLRGFSFLLEENQQRRRSEVEAEVEAALGANNEVQRGAGTQAIWQKTTSELSSFYRSAKEAVLSMHQQKQDPLSELFAPAYSIDPFRAVRVGGGLLPKGMSFSPSKGLTSTPHNSMKDPLTYRLPLAQFLGWTSAGTQIWARLKMAGLDVKVVFSADLTRIILKLRCPKWRLEQMAEQMHMRLRTKAGHLKAFRVSRRDSFIPFGSQGNIFRSSERQQIIDYILRSKIIDGGAELDNSTELGKCIVQRFPLHMLTRLHDIQHGWVTFWKREAYGETPAAWSPCSESYAVTLAKLRESIRHFFSNLLTQPLDSIAEYFGENIAFYFAFMAFYTRWLVFPSILGVIVFIVQVTSMTLDHWLCVPFAVVIMVWISFLLVFWRQKASTLAYRWGVLDYEVEETDRPEFQGKEVIDDVTGEIRKIYPLQKRFLRYLLTTPVWASIIMLTLVIMTTVFYSQDKLYDDYTRGLPLDYTPAFPHLSDRRALSSATSSSSSSSKNSGNGVNLTWSQLADSDFWAVTFFYPSLYGICVSLISIAFHLIAKWLNEFENHPTQTIFMNRLILKVFSFEFVSIFTSLYYYAFFTDNSADSSYLRISFTILSLMTVGQWWKVFLDLSVPSLYHRALLYRMRADIAAMNRKVYAVREWTEREKHRRHQQRRRGGHSVSSETEEAVLEEEVELQEIERQLEKRIALLQQGRSRCWEEALHARYNTFSDYTALATQMGFILCFGAIFPLTPLIALLNNLLLIRFNAMKICYTRQRPIAQKVGGIGVWSDLLQILSIGGVLTNCALIGFVSEPVRTSLLPAVGETGIALLLFGYEQVLLLFKYWLHNSVPSIPTSVQRAQIRERKSMSRRSILRAKLHQKQRKASMEVTSGDRGGPDSGAGGISNSAQKRKHSSLFEGFMRRLSGMNLLSPQKSADKTDRDSHIGELPNYHRHRQPYPQTYHHNHAHFESSPTEGKSRVSDEVEDEEVLEGESLIAGEEHCCHNAIPFRHHHTPVEEELEFYEGEEEVEVEEGERKGRESLMSSVYSPPSSENEDEEEEELPPPDYSDDEYAYNENEDEDEDDSETVRGEEKQRQNYDNGSAISSEDEEMQGDVVDERALQKKYSKLLTSMSRSKTKSQSRDHYLRGVSHVAEPVLRPDVVEQGGVSPKRRKSVLSLDEYDEDEDDEEEGVFALFSTMREGVALPSPKPTSTTVPIVRDIIFLNDKSDYHPSPINRYSQRKRLLEGGASSASSYNTHNTSLHYMGSPNTSPLGLALGLPATASPLEEVRNKSLWNVNFSLDAQDSSLSRDGGSLLKSSPLIPSGSKAEEKKATSEHSPTLPQFTPSPPPLPRKSPPRHQLSPASQMAPAPRVNHKRRKSSMATSPDQQRRRQSSLLKQSISNHNKHNETTNNKNNTPSPPHQLPHRRRSSLASSPSEKKDKVNKRKSIIAESKVMMSAADNPLKRTSPLKLSTRQTATITTQPIHAPTVKPRQGMQTVHSVEQLIPFSSSPPPPPHPLTNRPLPPPPHATPPRNSAMPRRSSASNISRSNSIDHKSESKPKSKSTKSPNPKSMKSPKSPTFLIESPLAPTTSSIATPSSNLKRSPFMRSNNSTRHLFPPKDPTSPFASITETPEHLRGEASEEEEEKENSPKGANVVSNDSKRTNGLTPAPLPSSALKAEIEMSSLLPPPTALPHSTSVRESKRKKMVTQLKSPAPSRPPTSATSGGNISFIPYNPFAFLTSAGRETSAAPEIIDFD